MITVEKYAKENKEMLLRLIIHGSPSASTMALAVLKRGEEATCNHAIPDSEGSWVCIARESSVSYCDPENCKKK